MLVDRAPQVVGFPVDRQQDFIQKPGVARLCSSTLAMIGRGLTERASRLADRCVGTDDPTLSQEVLDITVAEAASERAPDRVRNDHVRKAKALIRRCSGGCIHASSITWLNPSAVDNTVARNNGMRAYL